MGSYFQDNPPTPEEIAKWRADLTRGWPYTEDDPEPDFFDWTPDPDRSATTDSIYLLWNTKAPAVLVECGFLSNEAEAALLEEEAYQEQMAFCIYDGLTRWLSENGR